MSDNLLEGNINKFIHEFENSNYDIYVLLTKSMHQKDFSVAEFHDNKLVNLVEKPENPPFNYVLTGIYFFTTLIIDYIKKLKPYWRNEYEITEAIQGLLKNNKNVGYDIINGWRIDTGTVDNIFAANILILDKQRNNEEIINVKWKVVVGKNVVISDDFLVSGLCIIDNGAIIEKEAFIGPYTSVRNNRKSMKASIENSIIINNSTIMDSNSLKPPGKRLLLGENSRIYI